MVRTYDKESRHLAGPVLVFRAAERRERPWRVPPWDLGWSTLADRVSVQEVTGSHLEMLMPPHVHAIAAALSRSLAG
jgi:thioesterase domain-containing protein